MLNWEVGVLASVVIVKSDLLWYNRRLMKANIHPNWQDCTVTCACGNTFVTRATMATMQVDICSKCHPFFTGEERFVDKQGRIDKFKQKMIVSQKKLEEQKAKEAEKLAKKNETAGVAADKKSFKQILNQAKHEQEIAEKAKIKAAKTAEAKKVTV